MPLIQDQERSMLKLAQFKLFSSCEKRIDSKYIELILQELDLNLKVSSTKLLEQYGCNLIGDTLLHLAYAGHNVDAFDILIRKGANFNVKDKKDNTVLHKAFDFIISNYKSCKWNIFQNDSYTATKIIPFITSTLSAQVEYKNTENPSDVNGLTHFHVACATNNVEAVEFFLKNGVSVDQVVSQAFSNQYFKGYTGLHFAAQFGCLRVIEILLEHGANANLEDAKGKAPIHIALERNIAMIDSADTQAVYSVEHIARNEQVVHLLMDHNFIEKFSYLYIASSLQSTTKLENYLTHEVNVNEYMGIDSRNWPGYTALHFAAHVNVDTVKLLMKHGADIEAKDANSVTPFDLCIERYKAQDLVDIICLVPKWKNIVLSDQKTKLTDLLLAFKGSDEIQDFLHKSDENIELFVPFDSPLWPDFTILHISVVLSERKKCKFDYKKRFDPDLTIITEILEHGVDVTVKDHRNWTPVHLAFQLKRRKVLNLLLQYHYRMQNPVDDDNLSHLHIACSAKNENLVERLVWNNINVNIAYKGKTLHDSVFPGSTPLHIAIFKDEEKIAKLLLKFGANVHTPDDYSFTPVHFSMYEKFAESAAELSKRIFSSPNLSDHVVEKVGLSYLHVASFIPNVDAVRRLLDLGVDVNQVVTVKKSDEDSDYWKIWDLESRNGDTPLHTAMRSLHCSGDVISLLIERGGDIFARNAEDESPLENILDFRYEECLEALVAILKRDVDLRRRVEVETGITLLHVACLMDDVDLVKDLLDDGSDVTARIPADKKFWAGYSPLHVAYEKLCFPIGNELPMMTLVSLLLKAHTNFHVNPTDGAGISHFHIACHLLDVDVVDKFLEHGVDVNVTIDAFYEPEIAGCSPLLLTVKDANWRGKDSTESSAKLRIVELLINRGARVNVEDIDGNTPAHYAASCGSKDDNYLQLLADNGADVNTRNVRGKTPLELLIRKRDSGFEDIRYFIACGCIFNEFTLDTEEGYIALACTKLGQKNMESLLEETFANYPDLIKTDCMNRTALHNLVSTEFYEERKEFATLFYEKWLPVLVDIMMRFDCDADDQDNLGRTALHLSTRFRNDKGAEAMLLVGADFSITDIGGKPPFASIFEPCLCMGRADKDRSHDQYNHSEMFDIFMTHVRKMEISNLGVDELNKDLHDATEYIPDESMYNHLQSFRLEFQQMIRIKIEPYSIRLGDFMSKANAVFDYPRMSEAKRDSIDTFFKQNKSIFRYEFPNAAGLFQLQYRQAVLRRKMMVAAKDSLSVLARFQVPDVCSDIILRFLKNSELRKLIASTTCVGRRNVDVDAHCVIRSKKLRL